MVGFLSFWTFACNIWLHLSWIFVGSSRNTSLLLVSTRALPSRKDLKALIPTLMLVGLMLVFMMFLIVSAEWLVRELTVNL
jgi:hypothetical protein